MLSFQVPEIPPPSARVVRFAIPVPRARLSSGPLNPVRKKTWAVQLVPSLNRADAQSAQVPFPQLEWEKANQLLLLPDSRPGPSLKLMFTQKHRFVAVHPDGTAAGDTAPAGWLLAVDAAGDDPDGPGLAWAAWVVPARASTDIPATARARRVVPRDVNICPFLG